MGRLSNAISELDTMEQLADGSSAIHRLHPGVKLIVTFFYMAAVVSLGRYDLGGLLPFLAYPVILMAASETPYRPVWKRLALALPFVLLAGASNLIFDREAAFFLGGSAVSFGFLSFLTILLKTYLTVMAVLILAATTTLRDISNQMLRMKVPPLLVMQFSMTYRYLGVLLQEASAMHTAYLLRAPGRRGISVRHMGTFVGRLLLRSFERTERIYSAMKLRGFQGAEGTGARQPLSASDLRYGIAVSAIIAVFRFVPLPALLGQFFV